jgi:Sec-independent protein secretion pathway component TatC
MRISNSIEPLKIVRHAILIVAVIAAVVTPTPDATTMLLFMVPMVLLYFIGIGFAAIMTRKQDAATILLFMASTLVLSLIFLIRFRKR